VNSEYVKIAIWVAVIGTVFVVLWRKGQLLRLANYVRETREELRKCTWPTWSELQGSTVVVMISIVLLGAYTVGVDFLFTLFVTWMTQI
jgi:preprotein translocase subunit SecE